MIQFVHQTTPFIHSADRVYHLLSYGIYICNGNKITKPHDE